MAERIVRITSASFSRNHFLRSKIQKHFPTAKFNLEGKKFSRQELMEFLCDAEGVIIGTEEIDADLLKNCPRLRVISKYGVGIDNIDQEACRRHNIEFISTQGINRRSVSELTLGFMLSLFRNIQKTSIRLKNGLWEKDGGMHLTGKTVGIIGVGHIGKDLVQLLKPFGCKIFVNDIVQQRDYYRRNKLIETSKQNIFRRSDVITVHTPLTDKTRGMVNARMLGLMKKEAFFINTARGPIVDQAALKKALQTNAIAGAAIDVYQDEPPTDTKFLNLPNLICTPHIGGSAVEAVTAMGLFAIDRLKDFWNQNSHGARR